MDFYFKDSSQLKLEHIWIPQSIPIIWKDFMNKKMLFLAWGLFGLITISMSLQMSTYLVNSKNDHSAIALFSVFSLYLVQGVLSLVGVLIVSRLPRNVIGWLLICPGIAAALPAGIYIGKFSTTPVNPPLLLFLAMWFGGWSWLLFIFPVLLIPLLYPTGRLPSKHWHWLFVTALGMGAFIILFATFVKDFSSNSDGSFPVWTIKNPIGFINDTAFPILPWIFILAVLAVGCYASLVIRYRRSDSVGRTQIRWLLFACGIFVVIYVPSLIVNISNLIPQAALNLLLPISILPMPLAIAFAILKYRLWDIDIIIRRTLVYLPLTAILAGVFSASIRLTQTVIGALTGGGKSETATVLTTLIVVAAFDPVKGGIQKIVDARFKEVANPIGRWKAYGEQLKMFVMMNDEAAIAQQLLEEAVAVFDAKGGAIYLQKSGQMQQIHRIGDCEHPFEIKIPLENQDNRLGELVLANRRNGKPFGKHDQELIAQNANVVASAISLLRSKSR